MYRASERGVALLAAVALMAVLAGCDSAPSLPPADSLDFHSPAHGAGNALVAIAAPDTSNVDQAVAAVGLVSLAVNAALLVPRLVFAAVGSERPTSEGSEWLWKHTFPLAGWDAVLHGSLKDRLDLSMHITGLTPDTSYVHDFVWYTGSHAPTEGTWQIFDPGTAAQPGPTGAVIEIAWSRTDDTHKSVSFTIVNATSAKLGDELAYAVDGRVASMTIHDAKGGADDTGAAEDFSVAWNLEDGSGKMTRPSLADACWDTLTNGQVNIACPTGAWPLP